MRLKVNGQPMDVGEGISIRELVDLCDFGKGPVAVERNGEVVRRRDHATTSLSDGDVVEIVHFVGGGAPFREKKG